MFKFDQGKNYTFKDLATHHYNELNHSKILKNGDVFYYSNSLIARIDTILNRNTGNICNFFNDLKINNYAFLKKIITGTPNDLKNVVNLISRRINNRLYPSIKASKNTYTKFGEEIKFLFDYNKFVTKSGYWDAYTLSNELEIDVCSYCNRNYTFTLIYGKEKKVRPEFDHFLSKSEFPYLALSFYNLIPSCHICNSNLKNIAQFNIKNNVHPYVDSFNDIMKFTVEFKNKAQYSISKLHSFGIAFFYGDLDSFDIKLLPRNKTEKRNQMAINNISTFELEKLYNKHKDIVVEMIQGSIVYNNSYIDSLLKIYGGKLYRDREDILRFITRNYITDEKMQKRTFSKLTKDIYIEFGLKY